MRRFVLVVWACGMFACEPGGREVLRVGVKNIESQGILVHALAENIQHELGIVVEVKNCGVSTGCQKAIAERLVDLTVDDVGTGLLFAGIVPEQDNLDDKSLLTRLNQHYAPLGVAWHTPLGFSDGFQLYVRPELAAAAEISRISDLERLAGGIRIAAAKTYVHHPADGLAALLRRYGLTLAVPPLVLNDPVERYEALFDGNVNVVVGHASEGGMLGRGLVPLDDSLHFFPSRAVAVVVRKEVLRRFSRLDALLSQWSGSVDLPTMQALSYAVTHRDQSPQSVSKILLSQLGKASVAERASTDIPLHIGVLRTERMPALEERTLVAVQDVYPDHAVQLLPTRNPVRALHSGRARLVLVDASHLTREGAQSVAPIVVVGHRLVHVLSRKDTLGGRLGIEKTAGSQSLMAQLVQEYGLVPTRRASRDELFAAMHKGELDSILVLAELGDSQIKSLLAGMPEQVQLLDLDTHHTGVSLRLRALHKARIPKATYPSQIDAVETYAVQVMLAGAAAPASSTTMAGGPILGSGGRITAQQAAALLASPAMSSAEPAALHWPTLLSAEPTDEMARTLGTSNASETVLNVAVLAFLIWIGWLAAARTQRSF